MSTILPREPLAKISFAETHNATWNTNATALGTTTVEMTAVIAKTLAARNAYNAQQLAAEQAKAATSAYHAAVRAMADAVTDVIKKIKAKAAIDGNSVYELALIPVPTPPGPVPAPGPATDFAAELDPTGALILTWRCVNPPGAVGTVYQVGRQVGGGAMLIIGNAGTRKFVDDGIPAGSAQVTYRITAFRSTIAGPARDFTVKFGTAAGEQTASVVAASKLAA